MANRETMERLTSEQVARLVTEEVERQDATYGPFGTDAATVRLALACLQDELDEAQQAWREWRRRPDWHRLREETVQLAAVAHRLLRDIEVELVD